MAREDRLRLIAQIEAARNSRLIVAVWGDRQNLPTVIASDTHVLFFDQLQSIGVVPRIDVLVYTTGGHTLAAWGLANLIREYCDSMGALIPHRALSAGTLFTLAANDIVMSRLGQLSPIDPSITSPLGPSIQNLQPGQGQIVPISVEDAIGFFDLAKSSGLVDETSLRSVFERLAGTVHPLALGAVYRSREQILDLANRLLSFHVTGDEAREAREKIVSRLTRELGSHDYLIGRTEARHLGLNVIDSPAEDLMLKLFQEYTELLDLRQPYSQEAFLGTQDQAVGTFDRAIIETSALTHVFRSTRDVRRIQIMQPGMPAPVVAYQETTTAEGWLVDNLV